MKLLTQSPQYLPVFLSCNRGHKQGKWCGECPKCLFVYILLSAFLEPPAVEKIFGQNLLQKTSLQPILEELTGLRECKSLECVGTRQETIMALHLAIKKYDQKEFPALLVFAQKEILPHSEFSDAEIQKILHSLQPEHSVPDELFALLQDAIKKL